jgi:hypothetical protein
MHHTFEKAMKKIKERCGKGLIRVLLSLFAWDA